MSPVLAGGLLLPLLLLGLAFGLGRARIEAGSVVLSLPWVPFGGSAFVAPLGLVWVHDRTLGWTDDRRLPLIAHEQVHDRQLAHYVLGCVAAVAGYEIGFGGLGWVEVPVLAYWGGWLAWLAVYAVSGTDRMRWEMEAYGLQFARKWDRDDRTPSPTEIRETFREWVPRFIDTYFGHPLDPAGEPTPSEARIRLERAFRREWVEELGHQIEEGP